MPAKLGSLFKDAKDIVQAPAGSVLFREGDPADEMYILLTGTVRFSIDGNEIAVCKGGEAFGEMALVDDSPRSATAEVVEAAQLVRIDEARFLQQVSESPAFALKIMRVLVARIRRLNQV